MEEELETIEVPKNVHVPLKARIALGSLFLVMMIVSIPIFVCVAIWEVIQTVAWAGMLPMEMYRYIKGMMYKDGIITDKIDPNGVGLN